MKTLKKILKQLELMNKNLEVNNKLLESLTECVTYSRRGMGKAIRISHWND